MPVPSSFEVTDEFGDYSDQVLKLSTGGTVFYGRTQHPVFDEGWDTRYMPALGLDGNLYTVSATFDTDHYDLELIRWTTHWDGSDPAPSAVVVSATVAGTAETSYSQIEVETFAVSPGMVFFIQVPGGTTIALKSNGTSSEEASIVLPPHMFVTHGSAHGMTSSGTTMITSQADI